MKFDTHISINRTFLLTFLVVAISFAGFGQCTVLSLKNTNVNGAGITGNWTVPAGGPYTVKITVQGASGGNFLGATTTNGGKGAKMVSEFTVTSGQVLECNAGAKGGSGVALSGGGGGGGSGVRIQGTTTPLILAGGGGGATRTADGQDAFAVSSTGSGGTVGFNADLTTGSGGGGLNTDGTAPDAMLPDGTILNFGGSKGFNASRSSEVALRGGFGGGGYGGGGGGGFKSNNETRDACGGGGGGQTGGNGGSNYSGSLLGKGAYSINTGTNQVNTAGVNSAGGEVTIEITTLSNAPRLYVNASATGANTGLTWADAFTDLQSALNYPCKVSLTEIWVAKGTYYPAVSDQNKSFVMTAGVKILGGFVGTENVETIRNPQLNKTILSGDLGVKFPRTSYNTDNSYHVVTSNGLDATAVLDGFTIQSGGSTTASGNGGGMYNVNSSPSLSQLVFFGNLAQYGGGMYNSNSSPKITNTVFHGNIGNIGGGVYNVLGSNAIFQNVVFYANAGNDGLYGSGGGMGNDGSSPTITNCTFFKNTISVFRNGSSMFNRNASSPIIKNTIMWGNDDNTVVSISNATSASAPVITFSDIEQTTVYSGTGNLASDPKFKRPNDPDGADNIWLTADDGLIPDIESPVVNQGTSVTFSKDILGTLHESSPEMGAYEYSYCGNSYPNHIVYVNASATGIGNGTSWTNAFKNLQEALYLARNCSGSGITQIWVAKGTYKPTVGINRDIYFGLMNNIAIYGGFFGNETNLSNRNWENNPTILSGNIGGNGDEFANPDNSIHVVLARNLNNTAILDGFTIQNGSASNSASGGGIYTESTDAQFTNLIITQNIGAYGGGVGVSGGSPIFTNVTFSNNYSYDGGGGLYNYGGSPKLKKVVFSKNRAESYGGGMYNYAGNNDSPVLEQAVFVENETPGSGGGLYYEQSNVLKLTNVIFWKNKADYGGAIYGYRNNGVVAPNAILNSVTIYQNEAVTSAGGIGSIYYTSPSLSNTIVWDNTNGNIVNTTYNAPNNVANSVATAEYSDIQDGNPLTIYPGIANRNVSPQFVNPSNPVGPDGKWFTADDGLMLSPCSSLLNTGNNSVNPTITTDMAGNPRIYNSRIDIGAYETQALPVIAPTGTANALICTGTSASLSATCQTGTPNWYDAAEEVLQASGSTFITPNLTTNTTYKVRCETSATCSGFFVNVSVRMKPPVPSPTGIANSYTVYKGSVLSLNAVCSVGDTIVWFGDQDDLLRRIYTGTPFVTPVLNSNNTYKVACERPNCGRSELVYVYIAVNDPTPIPPTAQTNTVIPWGNSTNLTANGCTGNTGVYTLKWYNAIDNSGVTMPVSPKTVSNYYAKCQLVIDNKTYLSNKSKNVEISFNNVIISIVSGNWENASTWNLNRVPTRTDNVMIDKNHIILLNNTTEIKNVIFNGTGQLKYNSAGVSLKNGSL